MSTKKIHVWATAALMLMAAAPLGAQQLPEEPPPSVPDSLDA